jgi:hypothetical protein
VAHLPASKREGALLALMRGDMEAQGMVVLTAGMLRACAVLLAHLHAKTPIEQPRQVPGRRLFIIRKREAQ